MNVKQRAARRNKMEDRAAQYREELWSEVNEEDLWHRTEHGWVVSPRTMPLIINIIDAMTKEASAGYTFFCLWSRSLAEQVVEISTPLELATEAGFSGGRSVYTWRKRMKSLEELGFIKCSKGTHDYQFVLLLNPHRVIKKLKARIQKENPSLYAQILKRGMEMGSKDFLKDEKDEKDKKGTGAKKKGN
ncbi:hypothetical protein [Geothrix limicola]|nr:hypothetical protein [Geothrix limicola]